MFDLPTSTEVTTFLLFLPSIIISFVVASPVFFFLIIDSVVNSSSRKNLRFNTVLTRTVTFLKRLTALNDNVEGDFWIKDISPFIVKNHVQIPSRLLATLRTGVEWKKIDFAIGKVVEV